MRGNLAPSASAQSSLPAQSSKTYQLYQESLDAETTQDQIGGNSRSAGRREETMKKSRSRSGEGNRRHAARGVSRRELIAAGAAMAAAATASPLSVNTAA